MQTPNIAKSVAAVAGDILAEDASPNDVDAWNGNLESTLVFPGPTGVLLAAGWTRILPGNGFLGNTVLQLQLLFFSFVDLKIHHIYYRLCLYIVLHTPYS